MKAALVATWRDPKPGREQKALEYATEVADFWAKRAEEGRSSTPDMFLSPGTGHGIWFVKGDRSDLEEVMESPEGMLMLAKGDILLEDFTWEIQLADESVRAFFDEYAHALQTVG